MKKLLSLSLLIVLASCSKVKNDKNDTLVYYAADYKETESTILGVPSADIDAAWIEFYKKNKDYTAYALMIKHDGEIQKEWGNCTIDWEGQINFQPEGGSAYSGNWIHEKEKFTIDYNVDGRTEKLTFVFKPNKECKKH